MKQVESLKALVVSGNVVESLSENQGLPDGDYRPRLSHAHLIDQYLKKVIFREGVITHSRFERCNLREARFEEVILTGTSFVECNLSKVVFSGCTLWYCTFQRCELNYEGILSSLPRENNLAERLLRALRVNALEQGEKDWADRLLALEINTRRQDLLDEVFLRTDYHRRKNDDLGKRVIAALAYLGGSARSLLFGDGLILKRIAASGAVVALVFALLCFRLNAFYSVAGEAAPRKLSFLEATYYSVISLTTGGFGDIAPHNGLARLLTSAEGLFGVVYLGFFVATLFRRFGR